MDSNIDNCCRICLDDKTEHLEILEDPTIRLHLRSCLAVTVSPDDELPRAICTSCVTQLNEFYNFQLNARCSQDWLETALEEKKKSSAIKVQIQPLPNSEYNSDSLLEFLNNTANIEEYLNNLGKEDIPSIVTLFDGNENFNDNNLKPAKDPTPKKKEIPVEHTTISDMEVDSIESDTDLDKGELTKNRAAKCMLEVQSVDGKKLVCFACNLKFDDINKLTYHLGVCDTALRTCVHCKILFDSKLKLQKHCQTHNGNILSCYCGEQFQSVGKLAEHQKTCLNDYGAILGCVYICKECGKIFKERLHLIRHARAHVQESQKRVCDICSHTFLGDDALFKHKKSEHGMSYNLSYRCKVCSFTSKDHKEMYLHVQKHTESRKQSQHLCESCGHSFATYGSLSRHRLQHTQPKSYQCDVCTSCFPIQEQLEKHKEAHEQLIMCERCGDSVTNVNIDNHMCI